MGNNLDMTGSENLNRYVEAIDFFGARVHTVRDDQWRASTPCTEWTVRDLVNHLTVEQLWVRPMLDGMTVQEVGDIFDGDQLADDPVGAWERASAAAVEALREPGAMKRTVHLSYGDTPASAYCAQMTTDATVHAWDLSRAIGADEDLPDELATAALHEVEPYANGLHKSGMFAPPIEPSAGADDQTRLLSLLGRQP
jgi:uncharacterized protein (TIGR03086 family)